ncbi:MAG: sigma-70 family RNA polymerase sigma factor [Pyrinomonadaceae bacterium]|nr:sigma-70 family RNA polymerase sigma factor [Pyrinomonadaceae bacterium]
MTPPHTQEVTQLLAKLSNGDRTALDELLPLVYDELRRLADRYLRRERSDHTLQATALVNEAYLRLVDQNVPWQNRAHFFGVAAEMMRRILVDHARSHQAQKRGSGGVKLSLDEAINMSDERAADLISLDEALNALAEFDPQKSRIVELRFFAGLSIEETAKVLGIGTATVIRQWRMAKAWLYHEVSKEVMSDSEKQNSEFRSQESE